MAIALVAEYSAYGPEGNVATNITGVTASVGDVLVFMYSNRRSGSFSMTASDSAGNTWVTQTQGFTNSNDSNIQLFTCVVTTALSSGTVSVNASSAEWLGHISRWSGVSGVLSSNGAGYLNTTAPGPTTVATLGSDTVIVGGLSCTSGATATLAADFTALTHPTGSLMMERVAYKLTSGTTTGPTWTLSPSSYVGEVTVGLQGAITGTLVNDHLDNTRTPKPLDEHYDQPRTSAYDGSTQFMTRTPYGPWTLASSRPASPADEALGQTRTMQATDVLTPMIAETTTSSQWNVLGVVDATSQDSQWNLLGAVSKSTDSQWNVAELDIAPVDAPAVTSQWNILSIVSASSVDSQWLVAAPVDSSAQNSQWNILAIVDVTKDSQWNVAAEVDATQDSQWNLLATVDLSVTSEWSLVSIVDVTVTSEWNAAAPVSLSTDSQWTILEILDITSSSEWNVQGPVEVTQDAQWNLESIVDATQDSEWLVLEIVDISTTSTWELPDRVGVITDSEWNVSEIVDLFTVSRWNVYDTIVVDVTVSSNWNDLEIVSGNPVSSNWNDLVILDLTNNSDWNVLEILDLSVTSDWSLRELVNLSSSSDWNILAFVDAGSFNSTWHVRQIAEVSKSSEWNDFVYLDLTTNSEWQIYRAVTVQTDSCWNIELLDTPDIINGTLIVRNGERSLIVRNGERTLTVEAMSRSLSVG